ncbi:MAG: penicillin-binding protein 2 [Opitutaceae bacterium]|jgi:cell division protein FtsI/penicillin-binding protein 2|nr:penicillin-binding protein 2 [Opitutaceae bacterium]
MSKGFASNFRLVLLSTAVLLCFASVGVRLVHLHVLERERLVSYVDRARSSITKEQARRGDILDAKGDVLATSRTVIQLGVDPQMLREEDRQHWPELARLIGEPLEQLVSTFNRTQRVSKTGKTSLVRWAKLVDEIEESTYDAVLKLGVKGVYGNRSYRRAYPRNQLAAHLVGFVNREDQPSGGIEAFADFYLRGQDGWRESEKDGLRREMAQFRKREVPANDGYSVTLSIDSMVQHLIETELAYIGETYQPAKASIIVTDAKSGFLLGLANYPTFDLNEYGRATMDQQRNTAVTDLLDPGSTFKIVATSAALNRGLVTPQSKFNCSIDSIEFQGRVRKFMPDDHSYDHPLTVAEIISQSSNIGAAQLGMRLGEKGMYQAARAFGFGEVTGFPLGYESRGLLNTPDKWSALEITRIPAGYSVSATPIQIHYAMATIASGGELLRPQVVKEIRDAQGRDVYSFGGVARRRVIKAEVARQMSRMLVGVTVEGTAKAAAIEGYEVAGKTGTAQKLIDGRYSKRNHVGSFVGFFPASNPEVVVTVIVDDARLDRGRLNYGSAVAVPSFRRVAEQLISYLDIKPVVAPDAQPRLALEGSRW